MSEKGDIFCRECRYYKKDLSKGVLYSETCFAEATKNVFKTHFEATITYHYTDDPEIKNKNNDCSHFKKANIFIRIWRKIAW